MGRKSIEGREEELEEGMDIRDEQNALYTLYLYVWDFLKKLKYLEMLLGSGIIMNI